MALQGGAILVTALIQAQASLEAIRLNTSVSRTLRCVLGTLETLVKELDEPTKEKNTATLAELEALMLEIVSVSHTVERRNQKRTPFARLCRVLLSRSVYVKLTSLLNRLNTLVNALHLSTFVQEQQRKRCREEAAMKTDEATLRGDQRQQLREIKTAMERLQNNPTRATLVTPTDGSSTFSSSTSGSGSGSGSLGNSAALDQAAMGLVFAKAKQAVEEEDMESSALDELTSVVLFLEECEQADIDSAALSFGKLLGKGGFGYVVEARWNHTPVAVKVIQSFVGAAPLSVESMREFANELRMWKLLKHPNVVQLLGTSFHEKDNFMCFVMELCDKSLSDVIHQEKGKTPIDTSLIHSVGCDVCRGLQYLHAQGILHRDVKPRNVLLVPGKLHPRAKLCDFGMTLAKEETATRTATGQTLQGGTLAYMAPETLTKPAYLSEKSDVYAFGVLLWEMLERHKPFESQNPAVVLACAFRGQRLQFFRREDVEPWVYDILEVSWKQERGERPSAEQLLKYFEAKNVEAGTVDEKPETELTLRDTMRITMQTASATHYEDTSRSTELSGALRSGTAQEIAGTTESMTQSHATPAKGRVESAAIPKELPTEAEEDPEAKRKQRALPWTYVPYPKTCCVLTIFVVFALSVVVAFECVTMGLCAEESGQTANGTLPGLQQPLTDAPTPLVLSNTGSPTAIPTSDPTTTAPSINTATPNPSISPTELPTVKSTSAPTLTPTSQITLNPTSLGTHSPTDQPSTLSTNSPSQLPTQGSLAPSPLPTSPPSALSTSQPTLQPTLLPSLEPTPGPLVAPSQSPIQRPSSQPTSLEDLMARCFQHVGRFCEHKSSNRPVVVCNDNRRTGKCSALECRTKCFQNSTCSAYQYGDEDAKSSYRFRCELHVRQNVTEGRDRARPVRCYTRRWNVQGCVPST